MTLALLTEAGGTRTSGAYLAGMRPPPPPPMRSLPASFVRARDAAHHCRHQPHPSGSSSRRRRRASRRKLPRGQQPRGVLTARRP